MTRDTRCSPSRSASRRRRSRHCRLGFGRDEAGFDVEREGPDTHGQSAPIFGLAHLLGIELMPRIRNWQDLHLFRPGAGHAYTHIDALFSGSIDWTLIAEHLPDMLRVALSIKAGRLLPSAILRRLGTYSRKNRLYFAFRELGRAIRTAFLLRYIGSVDLRRTIGAATIRASTSTVMRNGRGLGVAGS